MDMCLVMHAHPRVYAHVIRLVCMHAWCERAYTHDPIGILDSVLPAHLCIRNFIDLCVPYVHGHSCRRVHGHVNIDESLKSCTMGTEIIRHESVVGMIAF